MKAKRVFSDPVSHAARIDRLIQYADNLDEEDDKAAITKTLADEVIRLRAEVERLNLQRAKDYSHGCEQIHKVEQEGDQLRAEVEQLRNNLRDWEHENLDPLRAEVERLNKLWKELSSKYETLSTDMHRAQHEAKMMRDAANQFVAKLEIAEAALKMIAGDHQDMGAVCMNTARKALQEIEETK